MNGWHLFIDSRVEVVMLIELSASRCRRSEPKEAIGTIRTKSGNRDDQDKKRRSGPLEGRFGTNGLQIGHIIDKDAATTK